MEAAPEIFSANVYERISHLKSSFPGRNHVGRGRYSVVFSLERRWEGWKDVW